MKLAFAAACLAATLSLATNALADPTTATLQQPIAQKTQFIVGGVIWDCAGAACVADAASPYMFGPGECRDVAKRAGVAIAEFKTGAKTLQSAALDKCNAGLAPKSVTASR
jgi:hypothetical protein